ncbi:hypothetical protein [Lichenifustis flavocetrariae]|uniref:Glycosyltransferase family 9 protein n=1 Tax=Lichenifustis flavocetrariae TaxID=2949735 RepID=A0AA42CIA3_9HYPH|nr:hypothetical protein [Lichenifustis flavocetrariae]MCW6508149.1 hypothetical protein [Lichenifustis flavocetrariae]
METPAAPREEHVDPHTRWMACMRRGDEAGAWAISEQVLAGRDPATRDDPRLPYHLRWVWDGRPVADRHVLVRCYHGLGDTLQFARYLPLLGRVARSVTLECQPELVPLLSAINGVDRLIPFDVAAPAQPADCDIEIMELAFALRSPATAAPPPYLRSPEPAAPLPPGTLGLCWQAGDWDPERSVPPALFLPLTSLPCVTLAPRAAELNVLNRDGCPREIAGTAALVAGVDHVVTVDSMVAHLAGALGRPTALLLKHDADWRWMSDRIDSPWYPSMRLYRQPLPGDWASVMARVAADLGCSG